MKTHLAFMLALVFSQRLFAQQLSPTLTLYRSEADFFSAVDVESTETFDGIPSGTQLTSGGDVTLDQVTYSTCPPASCGGLPWTVLSGNLEGDPVSLPNLLTSDSAPAIIDQMLSIESGKSVEGVGFYFIRTDPIPSSSGDWNIRVGERGIPLNPDSDGFLLSYDAEMPAYIGFQSTAGIERIFVFNENTPNVTWGYDNVSRTEVVTGDPIWSLAIELNGPTSATVGEKLSYYYAIRNNSSSGSPNLLLDSLVDTGGHNHGAGLGDLTKLPSYDQDCDELAPGSGCGFHVTYTVQPGEENPLDSLVEVHYHPAGLSDDFSAFTSHTVTILPTLTVDIEKSGPTKALPGEEVIYTYAITNTSSGANPNLLLDSLVDTGGNNGGAGLGDLTTFATYDPGCNELAPGDWCTFDVPYTISSGDKLPLENLVEVHYHPVGLSEDVSDIASHAIPIPEPSGRALAVFAALGLLMFRRCPLLL